MAKCYLFLDRRDLAINRMMTFIAWERDNFPQDEKNKIKLEQDAISYLEMIENKKLIRKEMLRIFPKMEERWTSEEIEFIIIDE